MSDLEQQVHEALETLRGELDRIKALLAEKDAALESLKARAEQWEKVATSYRNYHKDTPRSCSIFNSADKRCDICRAYDALSGPREGEQDGTVPKTVSSA